MATPCTTVVTPRSITLRHVYCGEGEFYLDPEGNVLEKQIGREEDSFPLSRIIRFDLEELRVWAEANEVNEVFRWDSADILTVGMWFDDGRYEAAEPEVRASILAAGD